MPKYSMKEFRYTPTQEQLFRAVAGAVLNAKAGHPEWPLTKTMARSIAKRATGTLTGLFGVPNALAERDTPSDRAGASLRGTLATGSVVNEAELDHSVATAEPVGASSPTCPRKWTSRRPLSLSIQLGLMARDARRAGNVEREKALVDVLRLMAAGANGRQR